jgi:hypothetical protein
MRNKSRKKHSSKKSRHQGKEAFDDLYEICLKKGLIEETEYGYIFKPEFFETLEIYEE